MIVPTYAEGGAEGLFIFDKKNYEKHEMGQSVMAYKV